MYNAKFVRADGVTFAFGYAAGSVFDIDPLSELDIDAATSQGFGQIGESVESQSVAGVSRTLRGRFTADTSALTGRLLRTFTPFSSGRLYFNDRYYCDCIVKKTPAVRVQGGRADFTLMIYCPYPYWLSAEQSVYLMNRYLPAFSFPVEYDEHVFGTRSSEGYTNCANLGTVPVYFDAELSAEADVTDYGIYNVLTGQHLTVNDTLQFGERVKLYRSEGVVRLEKYSDGTVTNILALLDETSDLWTLAPGENILKLTADSGEANLNATITMSAAFAGVYDGM